MAGQEADAFFDIAEPFSRLSLAAPFNFAGIDIDGPEGNCGGIDPLAVREAGTPIERLPGSYLGIAKHHQPRAYEFGHSQHVCFKVLIAGETHFLVGRRLQHFRLVHDENSLFEQPGTRTLDRVGTTTPDNGASVWGGEF